MSDGDDDWYDDLYDPVRDGPVRIGTTTTTKKSQEGENKRNRRGTKREPDFPAARCRPPFVRHRVIQRARTIGLRGKSDRSHHNTAQHSTTTTTTRTNKQTYKQANE